MLILLLAPAVHAQVWDTIPPPQEGGMILSTVRKGSVHYALHGKEDPLRDISYYVDLYKSTDDGERWEKLPLPVSLTAYILRVAIDSSNCLYYQTEYSVYRTTDDGSTWTNITDKLNAARSFFDLKVDSTGRVYLLSLKSGLLLSTNRGNTWTVRSFPSKRTHSTVTQIACVGDDLYHWWGTNESADTLFRSTNHGDSWSPFLIGRSPCSVIDGGKGRILVSQRMIESGHVPYRILSTTSDGLNWDTLCTGKCSADYGDLAVENVVFKRSDTGMLAHIRTDTTGHMFLQTSPDDGVTWDVFRNSSLTYYHSINFNARGQLLIYGSNFGFIRYRSIALDPDRLGFFPLAMNHPPLVMPDGTIYAPAEMMQHAPIYSWSPVTQSWTLFQGPPVPIMYGLRPSTLLFAAPPDTLVTAVSGLTRTTDQGHHWESIRPASAISYGNTSQASGRWLVVSMDSVSISGNNGRDWQTFVSPLQLPGGSVAVENEGTVFFVTTYGTRLWRRSEGDTSWTELGTPWLCEALTTGMDGVVFLRKIGGDEIVRSTDLGDSWERLSPGFGTAHELLAFAHDTLIALDTARGLFVSPDRGDSWTFRALPQMEPRSMAMRNGYLYLGTERRGILRSSLGGLLSTITQTQPADDVECLALTQVLSWSAQSMPGPFRIRCGTDASLSPATLIADTVVAGSVLSLNGLLPDSKYFWEVAAVGGANDTLRSMVRQFTTAPVPAASITSPLSDAQCIDPNGDIALSGLVCTEYSEIEISRDSSFQSVDSAVRVQGNANTAAYSLAFGTRYHARARSTSPSGTGAWSTAIAFHTIDDTVTAPLQIEPADHSGFTATPANPIRWQVPECVNTSEIIVSRSPDFSTDTVAHIFKNNPYTYIPMATEQWLNGRFYWKVRAWRATVPGKWSPVWWFTLDIPVSVEAMLTAAEFTLLRAWPAPAGMAGGWITIEYQLQSEGSVVYSLIDVLGRERLRTDAVRLTAGLHTKVIDVSSLPTGRYQLVVRSEASATGLPVTILR